MGMSTKPSCDWPNTLPLALRHADHGERPALDLDRLADRIASAEKVRLHIGADHGHRRAVPVFDLGEVAAVRDLGVAQRRPIGRAAVQSDLG